MFSARREVVRRGCTGLSQRVAVGRAQLLSRQGDCGPPGGLRGLSQTPEGSRTGWGRRAGGPPVAGVPGATARPRSPLAASQRQMLVVFRAAPGDSGCARGAGVCARGPRAPGSSWSWETAAALWRECLCVVSRAPGGQAGPVRGAGDLGWPDVVPTLQEPLVCQGEMVCAEPWERRTWSRLERTRGVGWAEGWLFCGTQGSTQFVPVLRWSCRFEGCALSARLLGSLVGIFEEKAVQPLETKIDCVLWSFRKTQ